MSKVPKCQGAQPTEGLTNSWCQPGLGARHRPAAEGLTSDDNGPSVPPKKCVLDTLVRMPVIPAAISRRNCATHSGKPD